MVVTTDTADALAQPVAGLRADERTRFAPPPLDRVLPIVVIGAVLAGLAFAFVVTPIGSGDYGQWLMVSRRFLGESVPAYRSLSEVPPIVPMLLAGIRAIVHDPFVSLHVVATILLVAFGAAMAALGTWSIGSRWAGALAVAIGLLVSDRFTDLFAFGGLLQVGALALLVAAVACFTRVATAAVSMRWWWAGLALLALCGVTHVGTATIGVPIGCAVAALAGVAVVVRTGEEPRLILDRHRWEIAALGVVGLLWAVILVPASGDYVANPASLAYRGPDRLFADLFGRWPTTIVVIVGATTLAFGMVRALVMRRIDGYVIVGAWATLAWAALALSILRGSATDYPRFTTPLLTPLVVGAAGGTLWFLRSLAASAKAAGWRRSEAVVGGAVVLLVLVTTPLAIDRHMRQSEFYELRDPTSLTAAATWVNGHTEEGASVLAGVREAKWVEGLTGHPALFAQSVRYAFRPDEWQRSIEADALLRSTRTLTSGYMSAQFTGAAGEIGVPTQLLIRANHGGEFVDLLTMPASRTSLVGPAGTLPAAALRPVRSRSIHGDGSIGVRTVWQSGVDPSLYYTQTVTAYVEGTTIRMTQTAPHYTVTTELNPAAGTALESLETDGATAVACFTVLGTSSPCVRIEAVHGGATITETDDGAIAIAGARPGRLDVLVTALTAGRASVGLGLLDPADVVAAQDVEAAILDGTDPAYAARAQRLGRLGFEEAATFGAYRVLVRPASP